MLTVLSVEFLADNVEVHFSDGKNAIFSNELFAEIIRKYLGELSPIVTAETFVN